MHRPSEPELIHAEAQRREDASPVAIKAYNDIYLGNLTAANDAQTLASCQITQTLNLAVNADAPPLTLMDGTLIRRAKVGLIDGPGNHPVHLVAAVLTLDAMRAQVAPGKPSYGQHRPGGILVHCRGGRSRSVAVMALWLARHVADFFKEPMAAVEKLRQQRSLDIHQPNAAILDTMSEAQQILLSLPYRHHPFPF